MLQNTAKTLGFQKIMVYKTPPGGGGEVNHIWLVAYMFKILWKRGEIAPEEQEEQFPLIHNILLPGVRFLS